MPPSTRSSIGSSSTGSSATSSSAAGGLSRRQVVLGLGGGGIALALVSACSSGGLSATTAATTDSTPESSGTAAASSGGSSGESTVDGAPGWARVNLGFVSAYVLVRGSTAAVVDTGVAGSADAIGAVLDAVGPGWAGVQHVVLTHRHPDHAGSMSEVLTRATTAKGYIGAADLDQVTDLPRSLTALEDGDEVFGLQLLATPGHTAGHMSAFDPETGVLVAGDALRNTSGLAGSDPAHTDDQQAALASISRLAGLSVRAIMFGHGDPLTTEVGAALKQLAG